MNSTSLSCKDLGNKTCDFVARGENQEEVKRKMIDHATQEHPEHRYGPDWEGALGREIDEVMEGRAPATTEDASQGGEFLDDQIARDDARGRGQGGQARGTAQQDVRVNVNADERSGGARDGMPERRAGDGLTPLEGEAEEHVGSDAGRRRP